MENVRNIAERVATNVERVIIGKHQEVQLVLVSLLCQGHILIEDVPGVGKTVLAKSIARSIGCSFKRIQFTPDLLPSDVTGVNMFNQKTGEFEFRPGPIVAQIVLADEINRATPKTQSALLESMEERQLTLDGTTHALPEPFLVIATQNPIEYEGTFPLPEAQLDRFFLRLQMGYPSMAEEISILGDQQHAHPLASLNRVADAADLVQAAEKVKEVFVEPSVRDYIVRLVHATREHADVYLGASPRGSLALFRAAQARAAISGRDYVIPDDVKALAKPTLAHRLIISPAARIRSVDAASVIDEILHKAPVPGMRVGARFRSS